MLLLNKILEGLFGCRLSQSEDKCRDGRSLLVSGSRAGAGRRDGLRRCRSLTPRERSRAQPRRQIPSLAHEEITRLLYKMQILKLQEER